MSGEPAPGPATCDYCEQPTDGRACSWKPEVGIEDGRYARIPYPPEPGWPANCRDCDTPQGGLHHPGCCVEPESPQAVRLPA